MTKELEEKLKIELEKLLPGLHESAEEMAQRSEEELNSNHYHLVAKEWVLNGGNLVRLDIEYFDLVRFERKMVFGIGVGEVNYMGEKTTGLFCLDSLPIDIRKISVEVYALPQLCGVYRLNDPETANK